MLPLAKRRQAMSTVGRKVLPLLVACLLVLLLAPTASAQSSTVIATQNPTLRTILTDSEGRTLYRFTKDTINVSSACYNQCATTWPPLLIADGNPVAGEGVDGNLLGVLQRTDGTRQVMYNGMPLYYYAPDTKPGDTNGQLRGNVWFVVHPNTTTVGNQPVTLRARQHPSLGNFLTDEQGKTLYLFTRDSPNTSVCYGGCATTWPPLLVGANEPQLAGGVGGSLGTIVRDDGNRQVTYDSKPLYYYAPDTTIGDTKGQGVGNVWFVVQPTAASASAPQAAPAPAAQPATLPRTGDDGISLGWAAGLALLLIALGGALAATRRGSRAA
jgi:predicted lipoprotein with Yx(FWY)xxD motif